MVMAVVRSEVLCFVLNEYGKTPSNNVKKVLLDFYSEDMLADAKQLIHAEVIKLCKIDRCIYRKGDNRAAKDVDDIYAILDKADEEGFLEQLPMFAAVDLCNIPALAPEELDVCSLIKKMHELEALVVNHSKHVQSQLDEIKAVHNDKIIAMSKPMPMIMSNDTVPASSGACMKNDEVRDGNDWATMVSQISDDDFIQVARPKRLKKEAVSPKLRRVVGTNTDAAVKVVGVPRRIAAYVGRLNVDTTVEDMESMLTSAGVKDIKCRKLKAKDGKYSQLLHFLCLVRLGPKRFFIMSLSGRLDVSYVIGCSRVNLQHNGIYSSYFYCNIV